MATACARSKPASASSKTDQDQRIAALEQRMSEAAAAAPAPNRLNEPRRRQPHRRAASRRRPKSHPPRTAGRRRERSATAEPSAGERSRRGRLHARASTSGKRASTTRRSATLKAFTAAYPKHRRVSYANNLIGRALLDKGDARDAAAALLANYRSNPGGERAPDSLFYLGQALMKLGQPGQACKAYGELDAVYGAKIRPDLKKLETDAKAQAQCS